MFGAAIDVGAQVQHVGLAIAGRQRGGNGGPIDARQGLENEAGNRHEGAGIAGGHAGIGLAAPPAPTDQEQAIAGVAQQLRRGNLAAAVADASALDAALQPLLAGWLAQAGARLAVEQAVQETLLRALTTPPRPI